MDMIKASEAAQKWGVTIRFVQMLCKNGKIPGAVKWGSVWMIPACSAYPYRELSAADAEEGADTMDTAQHYASIVKKSTLANMIRVYGIPGSAEECADRLSRSHDQQLVFEAGIAYLRGEIGEASELSRRILAESTDTQSRISAAMRLGLCSVWEGDARLWNESRQIICDESRKTEGFDEIAELALAAVGGTLSDLTSFPEWFKIGDFTCLPPDMMASAKVLYAKYLYAMAYAVAARQIEVPGMSGVSTMEFLPYVLEPMISQAYADMSLVSEASLRLLCAVIYKCIENDADAIRHLDRAIALVVPDRLYGILAEYRRGLDKLMDDRLERISPQVLQDVRSLHREMREGWSRINESVLKRRIATNLTSREYEVARLVAFGFTNPEIASKLNISVAAVKQTVRSVMFKGNVDKRSRFSEIL